MSQLPSVFWCCWLVIRKSIWSVKIERLLLVWLSGVRCRLFAYGQADATAVQSQNPSSLASYKSILVLPFWYRLTQVVREKRVLNGCSNRNDLSVHVEMFGVESVWNWAPLRVCVLAGHRQPDVWRQQVTDSSSDQHEQWEQPVACRLHSHHDADSHRPTDWRTYVVVIVNVNGRQSGVHLSLLALLLCVNGIVGTSKPSSCWCEEV